MVMDQQQSATLLVRHLPEALPPQTLKRLFVHYGASDLRACTAGRLKNCAFVDFPDEAAAARAQSHFHRLHFLGKTLSVERARSKEEQTLGNKVEPSSLVQGWAPEPIAPSVGIDYPFPPHLEYAYPPPDNNILNNILSAMVAVPKFYTQVLHLMNKMNLPAPFCPALPRPPLPSQSNARKPGVASDESELESSGEEENAGDDRRRKRRRQEVAISGPAVAKAASHEAAGVKPVIDPPKLVPSIKKKQPVLQIKIAPKADEKNKVAATAESKAEESSAQKKFATRIELEQGKLDPEQILSSPVFKNYTRGDPSPVLYIKNLEKDVRVDNLFYIFGGFFSSLEAAQSDMNIKLMQEGRMKGQAFVRFPSEDLAGEALDGAHTFVLKGKPMVIQFGRNK